MSKASRSGSIGQHRKIKVGRVTAILLTFMLFTIGSLPSAAQPFSDILHWLAHLITYSVIAFAYAQGRPKQSIPRIAMMVALLRITREASGIFTHNHGFEIRDAIANAVAALIGIVLQRTTMRPLAQ